MNVLKGNDRKYYIKHSKRSSSRTSTKGERVYSNAWLRGFSEVWDNDGVACIDHMKTPFERRAYSRGKRFAEKVVNKKN